MLTTVMLAEDYFYPSELDDLDYDFELGDRIILQFDFEKQEAVFEWRRKNGDLVTKSNNEFTFRTTLEGLMEKVHFLGMNLYLDPDVLVYRHDDKWVIEAKGQRYVCDSIFEATKNLMAILGGEEVAKVDISGWFWGIRNGFH